MAVNPALRQATLDQEAVLACTTVKVKHRVHTLTNVERVVTRATVGLDGLDLAAPVVVGLAQRAHDVHVEIAVELNARALVDDFVVFGLTIATQRITHVQHQGLALHVRDAWWVCPRPQVAARDGNAHDGHARHDVTAGRRDVDLATETGQCEVDVDEADLELKVQRAPHGRRKAWLAAEQQAGTRIQVQRAHVDVNFNLASELEVAQGIHKTTHLYGGDVEEVELALEFELEDRVDHAHAAVELDVKQEDVDDPAQLEVKDGVGLDHITLQCGVVQTAGIDAQRGLGLDLQDRDVHLCAEVQVQRKEGFVGSVYANGGRALDLDLAKRRHVQHHLHGQLHAFVIDQEVHRAFQAQRSDRHLGATGNAQRLRGQLHHDGVVVRVEHIAFGITATGQLDGVGGVDLQQEATRDAEGAAAVQDDRVFASATNFQAAVQTWAFGVDDQAQGTCGVQARQRLELQVGGHADFKAEGGVASVVFGKGRNDCKVATQGQQTHEVHVALACQRHIRTCPLVFDAFLARRIGLNGVLLVFALRRAEVVFGVELDHVPEHLGHVVHDALAKAVEVELELGVQIGDAQVQLQAQRHAHGHTTRVDDQQTRGLALETHAVGADLHRHVGKRGQALFFTEAEVNSTVNFDQIEQIHLQHTKDAQESRVVGQHNRLVRVAGCNGVARQGLGAVEQTITLIFAVLQAAVLVEVFNDLQHAVATVFAQVKHPVAVDVFARPLPAALAEVDGGEGKAGLDVGLEGDVGLGGFPKLLFSVSRQLGGVKVGREVDRQAGQAGELPVQAIGRAHQVAFLHRGQATASVVVPVLDDLANVQRETRAQIDFQGDVSRLHGHAGHTVQADFVDGGAASDVHANAHTLQRNIGFSRDQQAQVQVFQDHADCSRVLFVDLVDAAVAVAVVEVAAQRAIHHSGDAQEGIGIVDANGHGGDRGGLAIGQSDVLARAFGECHGGGHLQHATQIDLGVADLGLDDFFIEVHEDHVVATGGQGKTGAVYLAVLVAVFALL